MQTYLSILMAIIMTAFTVFIVGGFGFLSYAIYLEWKKSK